MHPICEVFSTILVGVSNSKMFLVSILNEKNYSLVNQNKADPIYQKLKRRRNHSRLREEQKLNHNENSNEPLDSERLNYQASCNLVTTKFSILDAIISSCNCKSNKSIKVKNHDQDQNDLSPHTPIDFSIECAKLNEDLDIITLASMK